MGPPGNYLWGLDRPWLPNSYWHRTGVPECDISHTRLCCAQAGNCFVIAPVSGIFSTTCRFGDGRWVDRRGLQRTCDTIARTEIFQGNAESRAWPLWNSPEPPTAR